MPEYRTVKYASNNEYVVKRSRFIGYISPAKTVSEATDFIDSIKSKHWDATHNVYAYVLRDGQIRRYSDDGEPQGTAGIPVLDVLLKEDVTDCVLVVTRYFGGVMLGAGGLVRAYSHTAKLALDAGTVIKMQLCAQLELKCSYTFFGKIPSLVSQFGGLMGETQYLDDVIANFSIPIEQLEGFNKSITDSSSGKYECKKINECYLSF